MMGPKIYEEEVLEDFPIKFRVALMAKPGFHLFGPVDLVKDGFYKVSMRLVGNCDENISFDTTIIVIPHETEENFEPEKIVNSDDVSRTSEEAFFGICDFSATKTAPYYLLILASQARGVAAKNLYVKYYPLRGYRGMVVVSGIICLLIGVVLISFSGSRRADS